MLFVRMFVIITNNRFLRVKVQIILLVIFFLAFYPT